MRKDATGHLNALLNQLAAQRGKKISEADADLISAATQETIEVILEHEGLPVGGF